MTFPVLSIFKCTGALSTFRLLCSHHHPPAPEPFHFPKLKLHPHSIPTPILLPWSLAATIPPSVAVNLIFWVPPIGELIQSLSFFDQLISLSIMSSRFLYVAACARMPCLCKDEQHYIAYGLSTYPCWVISTRWLL